MKRAAPAITLFFVAPLVAEFLLGNLPINLILALIVLAPLYGGGALLIREVVRRSGRGWPTILVMAFAYAVFEEAFTTQTLFNPNYLHLNLGLLKPAYIPALGMGGWWTVFVLTLHTVWSISVSIGLVEALVPERATTPWLGRTGMTVTGTLFILGAAASTALAIKQDHFIASRAQFIWSAVACLVTIVVAFLLPKTRSDPPSHRSLDSKGFVPSPWLVGAGALVAGSIFMVVPNAWAWRAVGIYIALDLIVIITVTIFSHRAGWSAMHRLALAGGAALAYGWHSFIEQTVVGRGGIVAVRLGNAVFVSALLALLVIAVKRVNEFEKSSHSAVVT
jgi:hypothetical protein